MVDLGFSDEEVDELLARLDEFSEEEQTEILQIADTLSTRKHVQSCYDDLIEF
jgi:hypothetical protein